MATPSHTELMKMKDMTRMTGFLTNIQIKQLQMWPMVLLGAKDAQIEFDPDTSTVTAEIAAIDFSSIFSDEEQMSGRWFEMFKKRLNVFEDCVRYLLGNEYSVIVSFHGKVLARSSPKAPAEGAHPPDFIRAEEWLKKQKK